ncbi:MAG: hypothetical protein B6U95_01620 [Thermofilum sp. ex4484_82]|nr:MAG: hypothetical protein B6U95_01620 [Thermofilum sp. ex4484_82]OYT39595.1 MAG: hypothetical protein B6U96_01625 [Archaeoglobales archaeon ex4484_92]
MATIKKLILNGIAAFPEKTEFNFPKGYHVFEEKNSAGKTRKIVSLTYALTGEAPYMRSIKDLIFSSGDVKKGNIIVEFDHHGKNFKIFIELYRDGNEYWQLSSNGKTLFRGDKRTVLLKLHKIVGEDEENIKLKFIFPSIIANSLSNLMKNLEEIYGVRKLEKWKKEVSNLLYKTNKIVEGAGEVLKEKEMLTREVEKIVLNLKKTRDEIQKLTNKKTKKEKELKKLEEMSKKYSEVIKNLRELIGKENELNGKKEYLTKIIQQEKEKINQLLNQLNKLEEKRHHIERSLKQLSTQIGRLEKKHKKVIEEINRLKSIHSTKEATYQVLRKQHDNLKFRLRVLNEREKELRGKIPLSLVEKIRSMLVVEGEKAPPKIFEKSLEEAIKSEFSHIKTEIENYEAVLNKTRLLELDNFLSSAIHLLEVIKKEGKIDLNLEITLKENVCPLCGGEVDFKELLEKLKLVYLGLQDRLGHFTELKNQYRRLMEIKNDIKQLITIEEEKETVKEELTKIKEEMNKRKEELSRIEGKIEKIQKNKTINKLTNLLAEKEKLEKELEKLKNEEETHRKILEDLRKDHETKENELIKIEKQLKEIREKIEKYGEKKEREEVLKIPEKVTELSDEMAEINQKLINLKAEEDQLKAEKEELEEKLKQIKSYEETLSKAQMAREFLMWADRVLNESIKYLRNMLRKEILSPKAEWLNKTLEELGISAKGILSAPVPAIRMFVKGRDAQVPLSQVSRSEAIKIWLSLISRTIDFNKGFDMIIFDEYELLDEEGQKLVQGLLKKMNCRNAYFFSTR